MLEMTDSGFETNFKARMLEHNYLKAFKLFKASGLKLAIEFVSLLDQAIKKDAENKKGHWVKRVLLEFETHFVKHLMSVPVSERGESESPDDPTVKFLVELRAKLGVGP